MVRTGRVLLVAVTKPLLCNRLGVKSRLGGPQSLTKAGGWWLGPECGNTAVSRAYTSKLNMAPPYICCSSAPTSAGPQDNGGPIRLNLLSQMFSEFLSSQNLKYFIRPPRLRSLFFGTILKSIAGTSTLNPLSHGNALIGHKGTLVTVANIVLVGTQQVFETEQETVVKKTQKTGIVNRDAQCVLAVVVTVCSDS